MNIATTTNKSGEKMFDKSGGRNYIDCIIEFIDNAKHTTIAAQELEELMRQVNEATANAKSAIAAFAEITGGRKLVKGEKRIAPRADVPESAALPDNDCDISWIEIRTKWHQAGTKEYTKDPKVAKFWRDYWVHLKNCPEGETTSECEEDKWMLKYGIIGTPE